MKDALYTICLYGVIPVGLFGIFALEPMTIAVALVMGVVIYTGDR